MTQKKYLLYLNQYRKSKGHAKGEPMNARDNDLVLVKAEHGFCLGIVFREHADIIWWESPEDRTITKIQLTEDSLGAVVANNYAIDTASPEALAIFVPFVVKVARLVMQKTCLEDKIARLKIENLELLERNLQLRFELIN